MEDAKIIRTPNGRYVVIGTDKFKIESELPDEELAMNGGAIIRKAKKKMKKIKKMLRKKKKRTRRRRLTKEEMALGKTNPPPPLATGGVGEATKNPIIVNPPNNNNNPNKDDSLIKLYDAERKLIGATTELEKEKKKIVDNEIKLLEYDTKFKNTVEELKKERKRKGMKDTEKIVELPERDHVTITHPDGYTEIVTLEQAEKFLRAQENFINLQKNYENLQKEAVKTEDLLKKNDKILTDMDNQRKALIQKHRELDVEIDKLKGEAGDHQKEIEDKQREIEQIKDKTLELELQFQQKEAKIRALEEREDSLVKTTDWLYRRIQTMQAEVVLSTATVPVLKEVFVKYKIPFKIDNKHMNKNQMIATLLENEQVLEKITDVIADNVQNPKQPVYNVARRDDANKILSLSLSPKYLDDPQLFVPEELHEDLEDALEIITKHNKEKEKALDEELLLAGDPGPSQVKVKDKFDNLPDFGYGDFLLDDQKKGEEYKKPSRKERKILAQQPKNTDIDDKYVAYYEELKNILNELKELQVSEERNKSINEITNILKHNGPVSENNMIYYRNQVKKGKPKIEIEERNYAPLHLTLKKMATQLAHLPKEENTVELINQIKEILDKNTPVSDEYIEYVREFIKEESKGKSSKKEKVDPIFALPIYEKKILIPVDQEEEPPTLTNDNIHIHEFDHLPKQDKQELVEPGKYAELFPIIMNLERIQTFEANEYIKKLKIIINEDIPIDDEFIDQIQKYIIAYYEEQIQKGSGINDNTGLWNNEMESLMKPYRSKGFKGVYSVDMIKDIPINKSDNEISFIMNTEPRSVKFGHWVAVFINKHNIEYYDSFGEDPSKKFLKQIKHIADKISPHLLMQLKINKIKYQRANTNNCGFFAMKFLKDRYKGKNFKDATGFSIINNALKGEKQIESFKKNVREFGHI